MSNPNKNAPFVTSVKEAVSFVVVLANDLERYDDSQYVVADAYSEILKLQQPNSDLETMIQYSSIQGWAGCVAVYQEVHKPKSPSSADIIIDVEKYLVYDDGEVWTHKRLPVAVVGPMGWHSRKLLPEETESLARNVAFSKLLPITTVEVDQ